MSDQAAIEEHNRRELWRDVASNLAVAQLGIERAQAALEDLGLPEHADKLQPLADQIRQAGTEAAEAGE